MWCTLCGTPCAPADCRLTPTRDLQAMLRPRCAPTAFHYAALMALSPAERRPVCFFCLNWKRHCRRDRRSSAGRDCYRRRKTYTPLDSIIMHALLPGHVPEPDHRCLRRLVRVAADPCNAFAVLVPAPAVAALERAAAADCAVGAVLRAWWDINENSPFFRTAATARAVRAMLRSA